MQIEKSESIVALVAALCKARPEFGKVTKDKRAEVKIQAGGAYFYTYADLASVIEATDGPLSKNGLSLIQFPCTDAGGRDGIQTMLAHESGEWIAGFMLLPKLGDKARPQELGGLITYIRRYSACAVLGIASEDNDAGGDKDKKKGPKPTSAGCISTEEQQALFKAAKAAGVSKERVQEIMWEVAAVTKSAELPAEKLVDVLKAFKENNDAI